MTPIFSDKTFAPKNLRQSAQSADSEPPFLCASVANFLKFRTPNSAICHCVAIFATETPSFERHFTQFFLCASVPPWQNLASNKLVFIRVHSWLIPRSALRIPRLMVSAPNPRFPAHSPKPAAQSLKNY